MVDTVQDPSAPIISLCTKRIEGIDEPVKLISAGGFAVGQRSNKVYAWAIDYVEPV